MKKFIYKLIDSPNYPQTIFANSVNDVRKLLMENLASESSILSIEEDKTDETKETNEINNIHFNEQNFNDVSDEVLMNRVASNSMTYDNENASISFPSIQENVIIPFENNNSNNNNVNIESKTESKNEVKDTAVSIKTDDTVKFFEEGGIKFKFEHGKLYKKIFEKISNDDIFEYRLLNKNNRQVSLENYSLEKMVWKEI